jgi:hypothetical protein
VADAPGPEEHTALYNVDAESSSPMPMERAYAPPRPSYPPSPADATMEAEPSDSFDQLLDDSIASFDTGLHQTEGITEIQGESSTHVVATQLTPMPAGLDTAINFERPDNRPITPPEPTHPEPSGGGPSNWILLPGVALASALVVWFVSSLVLAPDESTPPPAAPPAKTVIAPLIPAAAPVRKTPRPTRVPTPVTAIEVVPASPVPDAAVKAPAPQPATAPPTETAPRQPTPKPKLRRRGGKPRATSLNGLLRVADAAYEDLDCEKALPRYQEILNKLPKGHSREAPIRTRIKFCRKQMARALKP